jgi:hypothetical protein
LAIDVRVGSWLRENSEIEFANGNFVSTSIDLKNKSAGGGCRGQDNRENNSACFFVRARFHAGSVNRVGLAAYPRLPLYSDE